MRDVYEFLVFLHVLAGATGLLSMVVPLATHKGGSTHRRAGWVFTFAMGLTAASGLIIASSWVAIPQLLKNLPADPVRMARAVAQMREAGLFFLVLSLLAGQAILFGTLATRDKTRSPIEHPLARVSTVALGIVSVPVLILGATGGNVVLIGFGVLGLLNARAPWRSDRKKTWLRIHIEAMLGGCTVATTAFVVQTAGRISTSSVVVGLAWAVPVALGMGATALWTRRLRARKILVATR